MNAMSIIEPLLPIVFDVVKEAWTIAKGDDKVAEGILLGILGATPQNHTRIAMTVAKLKAEAELGTL